jgi:hypothetical protein
MYSKFSIFVQYTVHNNNRQIILYYYKYCLQEQVVIVYYSNVVQHVLDYFNINN